MVAFQTSSQSLDTERKVTDWRKQLIKQAETCCNIGWGLTKMVKEPEQLMVWLDAFEQGLMFRKSPRGAVELAPVRNWPVKLSRGITLGGTPTRWVLVDSREMRFAVSYLDSVQKTLGGKSKPKRVLSVEDLAEGELAFRKARALAEIMERSWKTKVKVGVTVWMAAGGNGIMTFGSKTWQAESADWNFHRQRDRDEHRINVHIFMDSRGYQPTQERLAAVLKKQRGWPKPELNYLTHYMSPSQIEHLPPEAFDLVRGFEYDWSLDHPRFNPWTRSEK
jgi:hypothetical protein